MTRALVSTPIHIAFSLALSGCPGDDGGGGSASNDGSESADGSTGGTGMTGASTGSNSGSSATTASSTDGTQTTTADATGTSADATGSGSESASTDTDPSAGSTGGSACDEPTQSVCITCFQDMCCDVWEACVTDKPCVCGIECTSGGTDPATCAMKCGESQTTMDLQACAFGPCAASCGG